MYDLIVQGDSLFVGDIFTRFFGFDVPFVLVIILIQVFIIFYAILLYHNLIIKPTLSRGSDEHG